MATARIFSKRLLQLSRLQYKAEDFQTSFVNGHWRQPRIGPRRQADLRKACLLEGRDPASHGLPEPKQHKPLRVKPPKGTKYQRNYEERKAKVEKSLSDMPTKITEWKEVRGMRA
ncbi:hypothetical protein SYNPS1DRAFT_12707 [Syncephalis pseudoplumigaleata]|uniref:Large ribosomal subunit protein mL59 domain-containing protein n=1 Tax=Syncephalis pseudoplumigaleata TaxID=1712513 RepID=A0A4P9Z4I6_9FUNG|nr:hypothetical protein SYNPS1DRAFT_17489 [Syncephalis pseudoplumigaleata]RKP27406.1 hypothetical protein SYNPS1DRAFT_12707 [Syncephalis pseudoplumigaleata]|eukprot:RKP24234.1 hypothetical protein SYNPS1DRAFT_17489 [Syncephalis pseudoplumigaleata]